MAECSRGAVITHSRSVSFCRPEFNLTKRLAQLRETAEQLDPVQRWYRILSTSRSANSIRRRASNRLEPLALVANWRKFSRGLKVNCRI